MVVWTSDGAFMALRQQNDKHVKNISCVKEEIYTEAIWMADTWSKITPVRQKILAQATLGSQPLDFS